MRHLTNSEAAGVAFAALFPVVLYLLFAAYQTRQQMSVRKALIDKFTSSADFAAFLQSPAGQKFIADLSGLESPIGAVLAAIRKGIVLILLGGGVCWVGMAWESATEIAGIGILLLCIGVGILIAAGISHHLSKSWGLIDPPANEDKARPTGK
jgi:hypothetical protein